MNVAVGEVKDIKFLGKYIGKNIIILISGKAGVGKTTLSGILANEISSKGYTVYKTSFAESLKKCATTFFNWDGKKDGKGRTLLQALGAIGRNYYKDCWVKLAIDGIYDKMMYMPEFILIDDFRFPNEYDYIVNNFDNEFVVITIRINSSDRETLKGTMRYNDESEVSLDEFTKFDYTYDNTGNISDLTNFSNIVLNDIFKNRMGD